MNSSTETRTTELGDDLFKKRMARWKENHQRMMDDTSGVPSSKREAYKQSVRILWIDSDDARGFHMSLPIYPMNQGVWPHSGPPQRDDEDSRLSYQYDEKRDHPWTVYDPKMLHTTEYPMALYRSVLVFDTKFSVTEKNAYLDMRGFQKLKEIRWLSCESLPLGDTDEGTLTMLKPGVEISVGDIVEVKQEFWNLLFGKHNKQKVKITRLLSDNQFEATLIHPTGESDSNSVTRTFHRDGIKTFVNNHCMRYPPSPSTIETLVIYAFASSSLQTIDWWKTGVTAFYHFIQEGVTAGVSKLIDQFTTSYVRMIAKPIKQLIQTTTGYISVFVFDDFKDIDKEHPNPTDARIDTSSNLVRKGVTPILYSIHLYYQEVFSHLKRLDLSFCVFDEKTHKKLYTVLRTATKDVSTNKEFVLVLIGIDFYNEDRFTKPPIFPHCGKHIAELIHATDQATVSDAVPELSVDNIRKQLQHKSFFINDHSGDTHNDTKHSALTIQDNYSSCTHLHRLACIADEQTVKQYIQNKEFDIRDAFKNGHTVIGKKVWEKAPWIPSDTLDHSYYAQTPYNMRITRPFNNLYLISLGIKHNLNITFLQWDGTFLAWWLVLLVGGPRLFVEFYKDFKNNKPLENLRNIYSEDIQCQEALRPHILHPNVFENVLIGSTIEYDNHEYYITDVTTGPISYLTTLFSGETYWLTTLIRPWYDALIARFSIKPASETSYAYDKQYQMLYTISNYDSVKLIADVMCKKVSEIPTLIVDAIRSTLPSFTYIDTLRDELISLSLVVLETLCNGIKYAIRIIVNSSWYQQLILLCVVLCVGRGIISYFQLYTTLAVGTGILGLIGALIAGTFTESFKKFSIWLKKTIRDLYNTLFNTTTLKISPVEQSDDINLPKIVQPFTETKPIILQKIPSLTPPEVKEDQNNYRFIYLHNNYIRSVKTRKEKDTNDLHPVFLAKTLCKGLYFLDEDNYLVACCNMSDDWYGSKENYFKWSKNKCRLISYGDLHLFHKVNGDNTFEPLMVEPRPLQEARIKQMSFLTTLNQAFTIWSTSTEGTPTAPDLQSNCMLQQAPDIKIHFELKRTPVQYNDSDVTIHISVVMNDNTHRILTIPAEDRDLHVDISIFKGATDVGPISSIRINYGDDRTLQQYHPFYSYRHVSSNMSGELSVTGTAVTKQDSAYVSLDRGIVYVSSDTYDEATKQINEHVKTLCITQWYSYETPNYERFNKIFFSRVLKLCNHFANITTLQITRFSAPEWSDLSDDVRSNYIETIIIGDKPNPNTNDIVTDFETYVQTKEDSTFHLFVDMVFEGERFPNIRQLEIYAPINGTTIVQSPKRLPTHIRLGHLSHAPILKALYTHFDKKNSDSEPDGQFTLTVDRLFASDDNNDIHPQTEQLLDLWCMMKYHTNYVNTFKAGNRAHPHNNVNRTVRYDSAKCYTQKQIDIATENIKTYGTSAYRNTDENTITKLTTPIIKTDENNITSMLALRALTQIIRPPASTESITIYRTNANEGEAPISYNPLFNGTVEDHFVLNDLFADVMNKPLRFVPPKHKPYSLILDTDTNKLYVYDRQRNCYSSLNPDDPPILRSTIDPNHLMAIEPPTEPPAEPPAESPAEPERVNVKMVTIDRTKNISHTIQFLNVDLLIDKYPNSAFYVFEENQGLLWNYSKDKKITIPTAPENTTQATWSSLLRRIQIVDDTVIYKLWGFQLIVDTVDNNKIKWCHIQTTSQTTPTVSTLSKMTEPIMRMMSALTGHFQKKGGGRTRHRRPLRTRRTRHTRMPHTSSHTIRHSPKRSTYHKRPHRFTQRHQRKPREE